MADGVFVYSNRIKFVRRGIIIILTGYKTAEVLGDFVYSLISGQEREVVYKFSKGDFKVLYSAEGLFFKFLSGKLEDEEFFLSIDEALELFNGLLYSFEDFYAGPFYISPEGVSLYSHKVSDPFALFMFLYFSLSSERFKMGFKTKDASFFVDRLYFYDGSRGFFLHPHVAGRLLAFLPFFLSFQRL